MIFPSEKTKIKIGQEQEIKKEEKVKKAQTCLRLLRKREGNVSRLNFKTKTSALRHCKSIFVVWNKRLLKCLSSFETYLIIR